ncbi:MAG: peroxiredoxin family protein [Lacipirellulaceae bacterium]
MTKSRWGCLIATLFFLTSVGCESPELPGVIADDTETEQVEAVSEKTATADGMKPDANNPKPQDKQVAAPMPMMMKAPDPASIVFKDDVSSNVEPPTGLDGLVFLDQKEERVRLSDYLGKKNVLLVFTEGFSKMLCPFCTTQTSRLIANYSKFAELDTEVLVVYPGTRDHIDEFIEAATKTEKKQVDQVPFPLLFDEQLAAVGFFGIESNLAHPSSYLIDKQGNVRFAYVGVDMSADRPSVKLLLEEAKAAQGE